MGGKFSKRAFRCNNYLRNRGHFGSFSAASRSLGSANLGEYPRDRMSMSQRFLTFEQVPFYTVVVNFLQSFFHRSRGCGVVVVRSF